uniref:Uncharacterized protein n=1 Tax=Manihot esculenta TaxID=3983 RepID=A0A2C9U9E2_MANES
MFIGSHRFLLCNIDRGEDLRLGVSNLREFIFRRVKLRQRGKPSFEKRK